MVRKLLKYECLYYAKSLLLFEGILLALAVLNRILSSVNTADENLEILHIVLSVIAMLGCAACFIMAFVMVLTRFYKNLFTAEGYLMFTLPVTEAQHIFAKLIAAVLAMISAGLTTVLYWLIVFSYDTMLEDFWRELCTVFDMAYIDIGVHLYFYIAEVLLLTLISFFVSVLFFYMCIAIGQILKIKNRVLGAVAAYFGITVIWDVISPYIIRFFGELFGVKLTNLMTTYPIQTMHGILLTAIGVEALAMALYFVVTHAIMKHKLNLE
ncbi:MAG: hypothetical protein E7553_01980 [Ruminococcaceae bacterium]|nr:hypothetical protein [Oscillospiraceae bacterium]